MGCCLGRDRGSFESDDIDDAITIGKNRPLGQDKLKWKSDVPMTEGQLRSKRDEFWETAPAFEGRKEIWDALRGASTHAEQGDYALAQAILDGANISLPDGTLRESYDELGNRYQVPLYCLSSPLNLVEERSESSAHQSDVVDPSSPANGGAGAAAVTTNDLFGEVLPVKFRLSTNSDDIKLDLRSQETVYHAKTRLHATAPATIPPANQQRWFFGGKVLSDKMRVDECNVPAHYVVQVVASSKPYSTSTRSDQNLSKSGGTPRTHSSSSRTGATPGGGGSQSGGAGRRNKHGRHHHHRTRSRNSTGSNNSNGAAAAANLPQSKRRSSASAASIETPTPVDTR